MRLRAGLARPGHGAEVPARGDAEVDEDLPQVPFDGVRADEQVRTDLLVRQAVAGQPRDLRLLAGQLVTRADRLPACLLAGCEQFPASPFAEGLRTHSSEHLMSGAEVPPCVDAPVHPTQPLAVAQAGARVVDG